MSSGPVLLSEKTSNSTGASLFRVELSLAQGMAHQSQVRRSPRRDGTTPRIEDVTWKHKQYLDFPLKFHQLGGLTRKIHITHYITYNTKQNPDPLLSRDWPRPGLKTSCRLFVVDVEQTSTQSMVHHDTDERRPLEKRSTSDVQNDLQQTEQNIS